MSATMWMVWPVSVLVLLVLLVGSTAAAEDAALPPVRAVTSGPKHHWFGYYDKQQFDPTGRYLLGMEVDFEHRSPRGDDVIGIGMVDLQDGNKWIPLGTSRSWGWQQGCMLQWLPGTRSTVFWNDREGDKFVCRVLDVATKAKRTLPYPIYTVTPDGEYGASVDFRRIQDMRPGYGYAGLGDPHKADMAPARSGIWRVDMATGQGTLILSLADAAKIPWPGRDLADAKHYFNHLLFNTDGARLEVLHRYRNERGKGRHFHTRMLTLSPQGKDVRVVDPSGCTSHFIWRDPSHILAWSKYKNRWGFYLYEDKPGGGKIEQIGKGVMPVNGHCTYLPNKDGSPGTTWILNDTYPQGKQRLQRVYLYHVPTGKRIPLGNFHLPKEYRGEWRVDTHPRASRDGRRVCIDSPHGGQGRQLYVIDIGKILDNPPKAK